MAAYFVPHSFKQGTRASAIEVNENFDYITDLLSGSISEGTGIFCVNSGEMDSLAEPNILTIGEDPNSGLKNIVRTQGTIVATRSDGSGFTVNEQVEESVEPHKYISILPSFNDISMIVEGFSCSATINKEDSWKVFDKDGETYWYAATGATQAAITVTTDKRYLVDAYYVRTYTTGLCTYYLKGSNNPSDDSSWVELDSFSTLEPSDNYRYIKSKGNFSNYKLEMKYSNQEQQLMIQEFDLYIESSAGSIYIAEDQKVFISQTREENEDTGAIEDYNELEVKRCSIFRQKLAPQPYNYYGSIIPTMKQAKTEGCEMTASGSSSTNLPWNAADADLNSSWYDENSLSDSWIQVKLDTRVAASACKISIGTDLHSLDHALANGKIQASENGISWVTLYELRNVHWSYAGEEKTFFFSNSTLYPYYRIIGEPPFSALSEFQLYKIENNGEYYLGEANEGDVWFQTTSDGQAYTLSSSGSWETYDCVPLGELHLNANQEIETVTTYPYNQNGYNVNTFLSKDLAGNIVTKDQYGTKISSASGSFSLPNGLMIQYGSSKSSSTSDNIIFPSAFPHNVFSVHLNPKTESLVFARACSFNTQGFKSCVTDSQNAQVPEIEYTWMAIGW